VLEERIVPEEEVAETVAAGSGGGTEKRRELRRRLAAGEVDCLVIDWSDMAMRQLRNCS